MTWGAIVLGAIAIIGLAIMAGLGIWALLSDIRYLH